MESVRSIEDCQRTPRAVSALASDYPHGYYTAPHRHLRAQLIHALTGVMTVTSEHGSWVVPTGRAVWMPAGCYHAVRFFGGVSMRTVYVAPDARPHLPAGIARRSSPRPTYRWPMSSAAGISVSWS
jgi:mannose-6-phosphate isomerase-like protein (cupin superfamily)